MGELLPYLPYDSGAMRAVAGVLRGHATRLADVRESVAGAGSSLVFDGPAGDRIRSELSTCASDCSAARDAVQAAAGKLESAADDVDRQNDAIRRHNEAVLSELSPIQRKLVLESS